ncbi:hypothetical protein ACH5RR_004910 [Cinchona calisaya]|uniref:Uncharacterized protein n=1 Tax=Cinchona calisaya TaxID=153742 RepID=A0ABD3AZR3_9GENT
MSRFLVLCLILMNALWVTAEVNKVASSANLQAPASSPSSTNAIQQETPQMRKLGKHQNKAIGPSAAPGFSPSGAPAQTPNMENINSLGQESTTTQVQDIYIAKQHHHSFDKSVAGGGVILGGLGTTFLVAVVCYIRVTRRKNTEPASPVTDVAKV